MAVMNTGLCGNPKRAMQMLWLAASLMFLIAIFHSLNLTPSRDWMSSKVQGIVGGGGRSALKDYAKTAETIWAKTVRQRHELIRADWGTIDKLQLYVWTPCPSAAYLIAVADHQQH